MPSHVPKMNMPHRPASQTHGPVMFDHWSEGLKFIDCASLDLTMQVIRLLSDCVNHLKTCTYLEFTQLNSIIFNAFHLRRMRGLLRFIKRWLTVSLLRMFFKQTYERTYCNSIVIKWHTRICLKISSDKLIVTNSDGPSFAKLSEISRLDQQKTIQFTANLSAMTTDIGFLFTELSRCSRNARFAPIWEWLYFYALRILNVVEAYKDRNDSMKALSRKIIIVWNNLKVTLIQKVLQTWNYSFFSEYLINWTIPNF